MKKTKIQEHPLNRKGYFPLGSVVDSEGARNGFEKEIQAIRDTPRLSNQEHTKDKVPTMNFMRDTLLRLHTMEEYGNVDDERKNINHLHIQLGSGNVISRYTLPQSGTEIVIITTFKILHNPHKPTEEVTEVLTTVMLWEEYN